MTYKSRLLLYVGMLILLVVGMMTMSFSTARNVILEGADEHLRHAALRKVDSVRAQREELLHYTDIIGSDLRLQEYLYIITALGMSGDGLAAYYERQFSSLPADCFVILSAASEVLLGHEFKTLIEEARKKLAPGVRDHFYYQSPKGVVLVAMGPVTYQGEQLATTFVAQIMDQEWLVRQERRSEDYLLFFEKDGNILWTSNPLYGDSSINVAESRLHDHDEYFRLHEVPLYETGSDLPRLWFGVSETHLVHMLKSYQQWVYLFAALGGMTVLLVGVLMLRNFRRPLAQLMLTTEQMINGQLPVMSRSESNTEMDRLVNRFADVLDALRNEQEEVRRAHKQLQETAITDSLTGLYNRRYLQEVAPSLLAQVERDGRHLVAVLLDLDHFKKINDCHGHLGGDAVLVHFARLLKRNSRVNDNLFRIGGEEFLLLNVAEDTEESVMLANKIRELVSGSPASYQGSEIPITVSIGISCYVGGSGGGSLSNLMRGADIALYEAKDGGRNKVVLHSSCHPPATSVRPQGGVAVVNGNLSVR